MQVKQTSPDMVNLRLNNNIKKKLIDTYKYYANKMLLL